MTEGELTRLVRIRPSVPEQTTVDAGPEERAALARRFGVVSIDALGADLSLDPDGDAVIARGRLRARLTQSCAVSGEAFATAIDEPLALRFVPHAAEVSEDEEAEFDADAPDEIEYAGDTIDVGEAVAQSLGLAIDPYAVGPDADAARREAGIVNENAPRGPLAEALAKLTRN